MRRCLEGRRCLWLPKAQLYSMCSASILCGTELMHVQPGLSPRSPLLAGLWVWLCWSRLGDQVSLSESPRPVVLLQGCSKGTRLCQPQHQPHWGRRTWTGQKTSWTHQKTTWTGQKTTWTSQKRTWTGQKTTWLWAFPERILCTHWVPACLLACASWRLMNPAYILTWMDFCLKSVNFLRIHGWNFLFPFERKEKCAHRKMQKAVKKCTDHHFRHSGQQDRVK